MLGAESEGDPRPLPGAAWCPCVPRAPGYLGDSPSLPRSTGACTHAHTCEYLHTYTFTHMHTQAHTYIFKYSRAHKIHKHITTLVHTVSHIYILTHSHVRTYIHTCWHTHALTYLFTLIGTHSHVFTCSHAGAHMHTHTHTLAHSPPLEGEGEQAGSLLSGSPGPAGLQDPLQSRGSDGASVGPWREEGQCWQTRWRGRLVPPSQAPSRPPGSVDEHRAGPGSLTLCLDPPARAPQAGVQVGAE